MGNDSIDVEKIVLSKMLARLQLELGREIEARKLAERQLNEQVNMFERAFLDLWDHPEFNRNLFSWVAHLTPRGTQS